MLRGVAVLLLLALAVSDAEVSSALSFTLKLWSFLQGVQMGPGCCFSSVPNTFRTELSLWSNLHGELENIWKKGLKSVIGNQHGTVVEICHLQLIVLRLQLVRLFIVLRRNQLFRYCSYSCATMSSIVETNMLKLNCQLDSFFQ